ncbi:MAG: NAD-dependent deacylase [Alphaproteobacteria bacterium]
MAEFKRVVVLTGAGVSAESGLGTFRDVDGLWTKYDLSDVATPEGFARNPGLVLDFYNARRANLREAKANAAHFALGRLEHHYREHRIGEVLVVTQNVDNLHEQGGSSRIIHMHGVLDQDLCNSCGTRRPVTADLAVDAVCGACDSIGTLRPDVVWFGEIPYEMDAIHAALFQCDLFLSIGTSGAVYPANGFVMIARETGAHTVELNLEPSEGDYLFAECIYGKASEVVPAYVDRLIGTP